MAPQQRDGCALCTNYCHPDGDANWYLCSKLLPITPLHGLETLQWRCSLIR
jgi:hypothetical protein